MWGFWEGANWIPVPPFTGVIGPRPPRRRAYRDLVFQASGGRHWRGQADTQGRCEVRVFFGKHRIVAGERIVSRFAACRRDQDDRFSRLTRRAWFAAGY